MAFNDYNAVNNHNSSSSMTSIRISKKFLKSWISWGLQETYSSLIDRLVSERFDSFPNQCSYLRSICDLGDHPACIFKMGSFNMRAFSVRALCLRMYRFQGFYNSSVIFCLSSGKTFGESSSLGNIKFL
jgi:hypothetical protein